MIKKIFFISLFLFNFTVFGFSKSVFISVMINDKIITNLDIEKESEYLKIFNPNLNNLEKKKILELAKNSLINEIIKKAEINKKINFNDENPFVDDYLKNIYTRLNYTDEKEFEIFLKEKKIYSLNEIKEKI